MRPWLSASDPSFNEAAAFRCGSQIRGLAWVAVKWALQLSRSTSPRITGSIFRTHTTSVTRFN
jgi:hypothetical protein